MAIEQPSYSFTTLTLPGIAAVPRPEDINNRGDVVGSYNDASGEHGFLLQVDRSPPCMRPPASATQLRAASMMRVTSSAPI